MYTDNIKLALYEACEAGEIDIYARDEMLSVVSEGVFNPLAKFREKIDSVKRTKPSEYDGPEQVKRFIDSNYSDIMKSAELLEYEPKKLRKQEIITLCSVGAAIIISVAACCAGLAIVSIVISLLIYAYSIVNTIITWLRATNDNSVLKDLNKIAVALRKVDKTKLEPEQRKKVIDMLEKIDDANEEFSSRLKVTKESMEDKIFEAYEYGEIDEYDRDILLEKLYS